MEDALTMSVLHAMQCDARNKLLCALSNPPADGQGRGAGGRARVVRQQSTRASSKRGKRLTAYGNRCSCIALPQPCCSPNPPPWPPHPPSELPSPLAASAPAPPPPPPPPPPQTHSCLSPAPARPPSRRCSPASRHWRTAASSACLCALPPSPLRYFPCSHPRPRCAGG